MDTEKKYIVYGEGLGHRIGTANTFKECKELHKKWLQEIDHPQKDNYAGLNCGSDITGVHWLSEGMAFPAFYAEGMAA